MVGGVQSEIRIILSRVKAKPPSSHTHKNNVSRTVSYICLIVSIIAISCEFWDGVFPCRKRVVIFIFILHRLYVSNFRHNLVIFFFKPSINWFSLFDAVTVRSYFLKEIRSTFGLFKCRRSQPT
jgi:hypothetical protein